MSPANGEQSRQLAAAIQRHLLIREPYRSYGVTLDQLFDEGNFRVHEDLYLLSVRSSGGTTTIASSATRASRVCGRTRGPMRAASGGRCGTNSRRPSSASSRLLLPTTEPIPLGRGPSSSPARRAGSHRRRADPGRAGRVISRPDQSIRQVWTSPTAWHFEFAHARDRPRFARIQRRMNEPSARFPIVTGMRDSRCAATSSRVGCRDPGCGSS